MKITPNANQNPPPPPANPDLRRKNPAHRRQSRRKIAVSAARTPRFNFRKDGAPAPSGKKAGPPTPLLWWKFDEVVDKEGERDLVRNAAAEVDEFGGRRVRRGAKGGGGNVSVRKLAVARWRLQPPENGAGGGDVGQARRQSRKEDDRLGFKRRTSHVGEQISSHHGNRGFGFELRGQPKSPCSVNGPMNGYTCEPQASFKFLNYAMEGATKWDPVTRPEKNEEPSNFELFNKKQNDVPIQAELEQAQRRIQELESERRSSKKKLKQFLQKLSEEKSAWRSREHEKVRAIINDVKADLTRERKKSQRLEIINSKLVNELAEAKLLMKKYMQDFEKERKNRELVEEVCDELAKEIEEDKAEVEALKAECMKMREEVDNERKMLQMAEVWREERVQMKLIDAKVSLEDKYSEMNSLVEYLQEFLKSSTSSLDPREIKEAELLQQAAASVNIQDLKEFTYIPPKSDDIFDIFEEMAMGSQNDVDLDDDRSGWETVSRADDEGSGFSGKGSTVQRDGNATGSGTEFEGNRGDETPTSEVCSVRSKHLKKVSSISRLWKSLPNNGDSYKIVSADGMDGRISNGQWSSPDTGNNPHIGKGMKGCIEWPRGQKHSLKAKLLEARVESQKIQLRQVLKQKI